MDSELLEKLLPYLLVGTSSMVLLQSNRNADAAKLLRSCTTELYICDIHDRARCLKQQIDLFGERYRLNSLAIIVSLFSITFLLVAFFLMALFPLVPTTVVSVFFVFWFILFLIGVILTITSFIRARETLKKEVEFAERFYDDMRGNNKWNNSTKDNGFQLEERKEVKSQEISTVEAEIIDSPSVNKNHESVS